MSRGETRAALVNLFLFCNFVLPLCLWNWCDPPADDEADPRRWGRHSGLAQKAMNRIHDQRNYVQFEIIAPSMPSGRYRGTRRRSGETVDVEYDLIFSANGFFQGTLLAYEPRMRVLGWYNPRKRVFQWAEGNHHFIRETLGTPQMYLQEVARLSNVHYRGTLRHAEVFMRVVEGDSGDLALVGKYISSDGNQGHQCLSFQPAPLPAPAPAPDSLHETCIEMPPLGLQKSESVEADVSEWEPTLEKEAM